MAKAQTTTIAIINADERGFVTRKQCRTQMREALKGLGLSCGLMESEGGKRFTATLTNSDVTVTAERKVGAKVVANATKKALKALAVEREVTEIIENDPLDLLGSSDEPGIVVAPKAKAKAKAKAEAEEVLTLEDIGLMSMDEQGELTTTHPRKGGLSAGAMRAILEDAGLTDIPRDFKRADMIELLLLAAAESVTAAPVAAPKKPKAKAKGKSKANVLPFMSKDLDVDDLTF
jgi:hypothetical protein